MKIWALSLAAAVLLLLGPASAAILPSFTADERYASIVVDAESGRVMTANNADQILHPASLTKIMTLYMTFDALKRGQLNLQQPIQTSAHASSMTPSKLGLRPGDSLTVEQAILGLVTKSANDAAVVLAEAMGGSEEEFGRLMTQRARALGMASSTFVNASGLPDPRQVTSARDMAVLALALLRDHPRQYRYFSTAEFTFRGTVHRNHNHLLGLDGVDGIKTGFINSSGFNLVASAMRDGRRLIGVVFGGSSGRARDAHMVSLLDDGFRNLGGRGPRAPDEAPLIRVADQQKKAPAPTKAEVLSKAAAPSKTKAKPGPSADELERQAIEASGGRSWSVQVGIFKTQVQAERAVADAFRLAPKSTSTAAGDIGPVKTADGKRFRARLQNLSPAQAKSLCDELKRQKHACQPMQPLGGKSTLADASNFGTRTN